VSLHAARHDAAIMDADATALLGRTGEDVEPESGAANRERSRASETNARASSTESSDTWLRAWGTPYLAMWAAIFAVFLGIRMYHLDLVPHRGACADEFAWTWSGVTLLQTGEPYAWSWLLAYPTPLSEITYWRGDNYRIVHPWLDHPPLYSMYVGAWMLGLGHRDMFDVDLQSMRLTQIPLSTLSFVLLTLLLGELLSSSEVLLALLFYSVLPPIVLHQRLVVSENLFVPFMLFASWLILRQRRDYARWRVVTVGLISFLLPLTKVAALSVSVFLVMLALTTTSAAPQRAVHAGTGAWQRALSFLDQLNRRWFMAGVVVLGTSVGIASYLVYGRIVGGELFAKVLKAHRERFSGFDGLEVLLFAPVWVRAGVKDIMSTLGIVLALGSFMRDRISVWGLAILSYAACMTFFVDQKATYGWYFSPLYPWICAALAHAIVSASRERMLGLSLLWCTCAWVSIVMYAHKHNVLHMDTLRYGYLSALLLVFGMWTVSPKYARTTIPAVNGLLVAGVAITSLLELIKLTR
jgi:4-amino-4-deoxy-L-arabinose transferase-like glycosyltransferase